MFTERIKKKMVFLTIGSVLAFGGCKEKDDLNKVLIISQDPLGNEKIFRAPQALFHGIFRNVVERAERSTLRTLNQNSGGPNYNVTRVTLGLKLEAEGGISDIMEIGGEAAFEMRFQPLPRPTKTKQIL